MSLYAPSFKHHLHATESTHPSAAGRTIIFHYGRERGVALEDIDETQLFLLSLLNGLHTLPDIVAQLQAYDTNVTEDAVSEAIEDLARLGLLEEASVSPPPELDSHDLKRYASQIRFFSVMDATGLQRYEAQKRIKQARVTVLGLGGLGSNTLMGLAAMGIGFIRGVDFDVVELGNLNRQVLYDVADVGQLKTTAAARQMQLFNPEIQFEPVTCRITGVEDIIHLIKDSDVVAMCADLPPSIMKWMNQASLTTGIPFLAGGYHGIGAEIGPFVLPFKTACLNCTSISNYTDSAEKLDWINERGWLRHPNSYFVSSLAANLLCCELCKYITGLMEPLTYNHFYSIDLENFTLVPTPWPRNEQCSMCGNRK